MGGYTRRRFASQDSSALALERIRDVYTGWKLYSGPYQDHSPPSRASTGELDDLENLAVKAIKRRMRRWISVIDEIGPDGDHLGFLRRHPGSAGEHIDRWEHRPAEPPFTDQIKRMPRNAHRNKHDQPRCSGWTILKTIISGVNCHLKQGTQQIGWDRHRRPFTDL